MLEIKFTYLDHEFTFCFSLLCILGTIGGVLVEFFAIALSNFVWKIFNMSNYQLGKPVAWRVFFFFLL